MGTKGRGHARGKDAPERSSRGPGGRRQGGEPPKGAELLEALDPLKGLEMAAEALTAASSVSEPDVVTRVPPADPERSRPAGRRAIFFDVENASKPQHLAHVIDRLGVDRRDSRTDLIGVGNWKVVGHDSARLLAQHGAYLVHSAPAVGVSDWSDLRIAVAAGMWLASGRPGDRMEIVSDDRAFDAVGDVAASVGIEFRRLSYRRLTKEQVDETTTEIRPQPRATGRLRRRGRRDAQGSRMTGPLERRHGEPASPVPGPGAVRLAEISPPHVPHPVRPAPAGVQAAPHDELVTVVRELVEASPRMAVTVDAVARVLKARGFERPPGSPRLVTRLRRIRALLVSPSGTITLAASGSARSPVAAVISAGGDGPTAMEPGAEPTAGTMPEPMEQPPSGAHRRRRRRSGHRRRIGSAPST